jgi:hypothetical protein
MAAPSNSKISRVQPIFQWLQTNGESSWPAQLVKIADGAALLDPCGSIVRMDLDPERKVAATPARLRWMIENANSLVPTDGRRWRELHNRVADRDEIQKAFASLEDRKPLPRKLILEGKTHADCLIECEHAFIWIEGKRFDWLSPSITWDVTRDQLARNVEAVWSLAQASDKEYRLLICHEHPLKHHERLLLEGYRSGTWSAGWPHISEDQRREFSTRIGTLTWTEMVRSWPAMSKLSELGDLTL